MGQAFWTGVRLPSSPPKDSYNSVKKEILKKLQFYVKYSIINMYKVFL